MAEPISLAHAKQQLRVIDETEDELIEDLIADARGWVEGETGLILTERQIIEPIDQFCDRLDTWPITSITSVKYRGASQEENTLSAGDYVLTAGCRPARLALGGLAGWPAISPGFPVLVTMQAGFAPEAIPRKLNRAMKLLITGFYEDRDAGGLKDGTLEAARSLCFEFRRMTV